MAALMVNEAIVAALMFNEAIVAACLLCMCLFVPVASMLDT